MSTNTQTHIISRIMIMSGNAQKYLVHWFTNWIYLYTISSCIQPLNLFYHISGKYVVKLVINSTNISKITHKFDYKWCVYITQLSFRIRTFTVESNEPEIMSLSI